MTSCCVGSLSQRQESSQRDPWLRKTVSLAISQEHKLPMVCPFFVNLYRLLSFKNTLAALNIHDSRNAIEADITHMILRNFLRHQTLGPIHTVCCSSICTQKFSCFVGIHLIRITSIVLMDKSVQDAETSYWPCKISPPCTLQDSLACKYRLRNVRNEPAICEVSVVTCTLHYG